MATTRLLSKSPKLRAWPIGIVPPYLLRDVLFAARFANGDWAVGQGSGTPTFTRATTATYIDPADGLIKSAASGQARFERNGLLMEGQRTNLFLHTEALDNAAGWGLSNSTISANAAVAPDGAATADKVVENSTASVQHGFSSLDHTRTSGADQVTTLFAKAAERTWIILEGALGGFARQWFDIGNGVLGTSTQSASASVLGSKITALPNGWYRCEMRWRETNPGTTVADRFWITTGDGVLSYDGDGSSGAYFWGMQVEDNVSFASSYIPTTTATVTRNQDKLTYPSANNILAAEGTLHLVGTTLGLANATAFDSRGNPRTDGVATEHNLLGHIIMSVFSGSGETGSHNETSDVYVVDVPKAHGVAWEVDNFGNFVSGVEVGADTSGAAPTAQNTMNVGDRSQGIQPWYGHLRHLIILNRRLSEGEAGQLAVR
ncbi:MAG: hypothetical protein ACE5JI_13065 [Acidobacteriota bacterium]